MKEIFEAFYNRLRSPVFGYFILAFVGFNWKELFYLCFSNDFVINRFEYFDKNTDTFTLPWYPIFFGVIGAIAYPWISYVFIWIGQVPSELRQDIQLTSDSKMLTRKKQLEEERNELLKAKEIELIRRAKSDEEIKSLPDNEIRNQLEKEIDELRTKLSDKNLQPDQVLNNQKLSELINTYHNISGLYERLGELDTAKSYLEKAANLREDQLNLNAFPNDRSK